MNTTPLTLQEELANFYEKSGFGSVIGMRPLTVPVYTGCMLVPLPNIETRRQYLKYHDLHHLITGYSVGRIGEGEVSAWELGTGSAFVSPLLGVMNLIALSTGLVLEPKRMWSSFSRGCKSKNLYSKSCRSNVDSAHWPSLATLRADVLEVKNPRFPMAFRALEFAFYSACAMFIHALIAIPAVCVRFITDITLGYSIFQAVKPKKRVDLF
ncbi:MAG: hypothetical protein H6975_04220 [Gammaproteobacteria bacterium]|nr:hypothetical protein [Gammaproteobacteria bacterium]